VCTALTVSSTWAIPSNTRGLSLDLRYSISGSNVINTIDNVSIIFYPDPACGSTAIFTFDMRAREWVASANTEMLTSHIVIPFITVTADKIYYFATKTGGVATLLNIGMLGYYD
jgi:hypothetical protein